MIATQRRVMPEAVAVAPELVGAELASPTRRLAAMLLDLACVGIASQFGFGILAIVAAIATWRAASRQASVVRRRGGRVAAGVLALMAVAIGISEVRAIKDDMVKVSVDGSDVGISGSDMLALLPETVALSQAATDAEADVLAQQIVAKLRASSTDPAQVDRGLAALAEKENSPRVRAALQRALLPSGHAPDAELVRSYSDALIAGDAARAGELRPKVADQVAEPELRAARLRSQQARETNRALVDELEEAKTPFLRRSLSGMLDMLGLGLGWSALYFTALTAAWKGQTVGKRLLGTRVVRLDGKPLTWWMAFNRYGGYAASAFLGMTGFATVLNDRHRQALHDKIAWTVVVRT